ncbi:MAG: biotin-dependent carboxyltransferase family protein, partial [Pseudomonadota bacterium]
MIEVVRPGMLDLVMDLGRPGYRAQGVPEGGAADAEALILANRLVGNPERAAGLEMLLRGPRLRFPRGARLALTGAPMPARLDGAAVPWGQTFDVAPGGELELGTAQKGLRAYLALAGGIAVPPVLGSRSTFLPSAFGGWRGRALAAGALLPVGPA